MQSVLASKKMFAGLGGKSSKHPVPGACNVLLEFDRLFYLLVAQNMWNKPKSRDQYFMDVLDQSVDPFGTTVYEEEEARMRKRQFFKGDHWKGLTPVSPGSGSLQLYAYPAVVPRGYNYVYGVSTLRDR